MVITVAHSGLEHDGTLKRVEYEYIMMSEYNTFEDAYISDAPKIFRLIPRTLPTSETLETTQKLFGYFFGIHVWAALGQGSFSARIKS